MSVIDKDVFNQLASLMGDRMSLLTSKFADESSNQIKNLKSSLEEGDWATSERMAHSLKSSSRSLGVMEMSVYAANIESACRIKDKDAIMPMLATLETEFDKANQEIKTL